MSETVTDLITSLEGKIAELDRLMMHHNKELARLSALRGHYLIVLRDLKTSGRTDTSEGSSADNAFHEDEVTDGTPDDMGDLPPLPDELTLLLSSKSLSVCRSAFAIIFFLGPSTLDAVHKILIRFGLARPGSKGKDKLRAIIQGDFARNGRVKVTPETKLYAFTSDSAKEWFRGVLDIADTVRAESRQLMLLERPKPPEDSK